MQIIESRMAAHKEACLWRNIISVIFAHKHSEGTGETPHMSPAADIFAISCHNQQGFFKQMSSQLSWSRCEILGFTSAHRLNGKTSPTPLPFIYFSIPDNSADPDFPADSGPVFTRVRAAACVCVKGGCR